MRKLKELFLVDTGELLTESEEDFDFYSSVYDHKYGYYDYDQYYTREIGEAKDYAMEQVNKKIPNFYMIIVSQGYSKITDDDIENGNYSVHNANYSANDIIWSIKTDENGLNPVFNFVEGQKNYGKI